MIRTGSAFIIIDTERKINLHLVCFSSTHGFAKNPAGSFSDTAGIISLAFYDKTAGSRIEKFGNAKLPWGRGIGSRSDLLPRF